MFLLSNGSPAATTTDRRKILWLLCISGMGHSRTTIAFLPRGMDESLVSTGRQVERDIYICTHKPKALWLEYRMERIAKVVRNVERCGSCCLLPLATCWCPTLSDQSTDVAPKSVTLSERRNPSSYINTINEARFQTVSRSGFYDDTPHFWTKIGGIEVVGCGWCRKSPWSLVD